MSNVTFVRLTQESEKTSSQFTPEVPEEILFWRAARHSAAVCRPDVFARVRPSAVATDV